MNWQMFGIVLNPVEVTEGKFRKKFPFFILNYIIFSVAKGCDWVDFSRVSPVGVLPRVSDGKGGRSAASAQHRNEVQPCTARPKGGNGGRGAAGAAAVTTNRRDTPKN